jgi:hypothetical protein
MTESIRNEAVYTLTGDQLKQFGNQLLAAFVESQKKTDPIYLKKTCGKSEAARHLGKNRTTIYHMVNDGRLKATGDGKVIVSSIIDYENGNVVNKKEVATNKRGNKVYV